jgi:hypothetical protein
VAGAGPKVAVAGVRFRRVACGELGLSDEYRPEMRATQQPYDQKDDQHDTKNTSDAIPAISAIAIVSATTTEDQNQHNNYKYHSHDLFCLLRE